MSPSNNQRCNQNDNDDATFTASKSKLNNFDNINSNINVNINVNINGNSNNDDVVNNSNLSPTTAAISTAAAVAAVTSSAFADKSIINTGKSSQDVDIIDSVPMLSNLYNKHSVGPRVTSQHQNHSQQQPKEQHGRVSNITSCNTSVNSSNTTTPCPTPGPLAPPPRRLLPQNQLVFNQQPTINNNYNGSNSINSRPSTSSSQYPASSQQPQLRHPGAAFAATATSNPNMSATFHQPHHNGHSNSSSSFVGANVNVNSNHSAPASFHPRQMQLGTPPNIFVNAALRRGKWTAEEERFANALIEEFEKGTILDCENGCTLRAYLSRKLHCAPMRISKKYAGKSIGKHVFLSRISSLTNRAGNTTLAPVALNGGLNILPASSSQVNVEKMRDLEFRFHMSLLSEGATSCALGSHALGNTMNGNPNCNIAARVEMNVTAAMNRVSGQTSVSSGGNNNVATTTSTTGAFFPMIYSSTNPGYAANIPGSYTASSSIIPAPHNIITNMPSHNTTASPQSTTFQWFAPGSSTGTKATTAPNSGSNMNVQGLSATMQMKETLLNAFKEAQSSSHTPPNVAKSEKSESTVSQQQHQQQSVSNYIQHNCHIAQSSNNNSNSASQLAENQMNSVGRSSTKVNSFDNSALSELYSQFKAHSKDNDGESNNDPNNISTSQAQQNWLSETMHIIPTLDPSNYMGQYSPTYTSQSFDDLHHFIGNDYSPPPADSTKGSENPFDEIKGPATDAANSMHLPSINSISIADAYALFAQQSATAVSKHSAYANHVEGNATNSNILTVHSNNISSNEIPRLANHQQNHYSSTMNENIQAKQFLESTEKVTVSQIKVENPSATFNAANLQLHSVAVSELETADKATDDNTESESLSNDSGDIEPASTSSVTARTSNKFNSSDFKHQNIVSGSDRSSSDNGNESVSVNCSGMSGSDNASDNSDSASDEGRGSSKTNKHSCKRRNSNNTDIHEKEQGTKRLKSSIKTEA